MAPFTAGNAIERQALVIEVLERAAKTAARTSNWRRKDALKKLAEKLKACRPNARCGSLACQSCSRAFQKAKVAAQRRLIRELEGRRKGRYLTFVTLIPKDRSYKPGQIATVDVKKLNRTLKDTLTRISLNRVVQGSIDFSWETKRRERCLQTHWHLAMWTRKPKRLGEKLKTAFSRAKKYERPVDVRDTDDLGFLAYMNKVVKMPELLRNARRQLPEIMLLLDRTEPLDALVLMRLRLATKGHHLRFREISR